MVPVNGVFAKIPSAKMNGSHLLPLKYLLLLNNE